MLRRKIRGKRRTLDEIEVDVDEIIDVDQPEFNDVYRDQFGLPVSRLYRAYDPPFAKIRARARELYEELKKQREKE